MSNETFEEAEATEATPAVDAYLLAQIQQEDLEAITRRLLALQKEYEPAAEHAERLKHQLAAAEQRMITIMREASPPIQRHTAGGVTFYVYEKFFVNKRKEVTTDDICELLQSSKVGLADIVNPTYNAARLKAWVVEKAKEAWEEIQHFEQERTKRKLSNDEERRLTLLKTYAKVPPKLYKMLNFVKVPALGKRKVN